MSDGRVALHIDRLVLRGIDPSDQRALADGLKTELTRVLAETGLRGAMAKSRRSPVLRLGRVAMQPGVAGARALGRGVAKAIGKGLKS